MSSADRDLWEFIESGHQGGAMTIVKGRYVPWVDLITCRGIQALKADRMCRWCIQPLEDRRQIVSCSPECTRGFDLNHFWSQARHEALRRAIVAWVPPRFTPRHDTWDPRIAIEYSGHYCCAHCLEATTSPEVNHIVPVEGGARSVTCLNHQTNLEVLCHACHLVVTNHQLALRRERIASTQIPQGAGEPSGTH